MPLAVLSIDLEARLATLQAGMDQAARLAERGAARMEAAFANVGRGALALTAVAAGTAYLQQTIRPAIDLADRIDDLGEKFGVAAGSLSEYRFAAEVAGTPTDALASGLQKLSKASSEGNKGLALMGISTKNLDGSLKDADQLLLEVADKFARYQDGAGKAALAQEVFGKSGTDMIPLLNRGAAGIRELRGEAVQLGAAFGSDLARQAGEFNDSLKRMQLSIEGATVGLVGQFLPAMNTLLEKLLAGVRAFGSLRAAIEMVGFKTNPFASAGEVLRDVSSEFEANAGRIEKVQAILGRPNLSEPVANRYRGEVRSLTERNAVLAKYLQYLKESQRIDALKDSGGVLDARDARVAAAKDAGKIKPPALGDATAAEQAQKQFDALIDGIRKQRAEAEAELASGARLTEADKLRVDVLGKLASAQSKLTAEQQALVRAELDGALSSMNAAKAQEELARARDYSAKLADKVLSGYEREADALIGANQQLQQQTAAFGLTETALGALTLARLDDLIVQKQQQLVAAQNIENNQAEVEAIERLLRLLKRQRELTGQLQGVRRDARENPTTGAAKAVEEFLQRTVAAGDAAKAAIGGALSTLENDLVNSLSQGKLDVRSFVDYMIKEFLRLQVVKPLLNDLIGAGGSGGGFIKGLMSIFGFAKGGAISGGVPIKAFAAGGVVGSPALFGMRSGLGLMGEAGPEAIVPLRRASDGRLGVAGGGGVTNITYNVASGVTRNELVTALQLLRQTVAADTMGALRARGLA